MSGFFRANILVVVVVDYAYSWDVIITGLFAVSLWINGYAKTTCCKTLNFWIFLMTSRKLFFKT